MKKLLALILVIALAVPAFVLAEDEYTPALGMTIGKYLQKYNAVSAPLGSPYNKLDSPIAWTDSNQYQVSWFYPVNDSHVILLLSSRDTGNIKSLDCGLDIVQISTNSDKDLIDFICVAARCCEPVADNFLGVSFGDIRITQLLRYYFDNGYKGTSGSAYWSINEDDKIVLQFFMDSGWYYFQICSVEDAG